MHRVLIDDRPIAGLAYRVEGEEARHAIRVKRLEPGEPVELLDGRGLLARGSVLGSEKSGARGEWVLVVGVESIDPAPRESPAVDVLAPAPKGDRLVEMVEGLSQVGAASWAALRCARAQTEPSEHKVERLHRIARESAKQCGRVWSLEIQAGVEFEDALVACGDGPCPMLLADASGPAFRASMVPVGSVRVRLLIGAEGGWEPAEVGSAARAGAVVCSFGRHVMRVEQAAVVAAAIVMHELQARA